MRPTWVILTLPTLALPTGSGNNRAARGEFATKTPERDAPTPMIDVALAPEPAVEQTEAYQTLLTRVGRRSPKIPAEVLVRHVLRCVPPDEWPVRVEAMD